MGLIEKVPLPAVAVTSLDFIFNWARRSSPWVLTYGIACCAIEMMATSAARYDLERLGVIFRATPRQSDVMIVAGNVNKKMVPVIRTLYEQMAEPRYVIAMGACAVSGGAFWDTYNVVQGVDKILPVDVFVPGCHPRCEALIYGVMQLQEKIKTESIRDQRNGYRIVVDPEVTEREINEMAEKLAREADMVPPGADEKETASGARA